MSLILKVDVLCGLKGNGSEMMRRARLFSMVSVSSSSMCTEVANKQARMLVAVVSLGLNIFAELKHTEAQQTSSNAMTTARCCLHPESSGCLQQAHHSHSCTNMHLDCRIRGHNRTLEVYRGGI